MKPVKSDPIQDMLQRLYELVEQQNTIAKMRGLLKTRQIQGALAVAFEERLWTMHQTVNEEIDRLMQDVAEWPV
jgi:hypothetical protein